MNDSRPPAEHRGTAAAETQTDGRPSNGSDEQILAEVDPTRRRSILAELREAGVPVESDPKTEDLMVKAYLEFGGVPSRIVPAAEGSHSVPDLTADEKGRDILARLSARSEGT